MPLSLSSLLVRVQIVFVDNERSEYTLDDDDDIKIFSISDDDVESKLFAISDDDVDNKLFVSCELVVVAVVDAAVIDEIENFSRLKVRNVKFVLSFVNFKSPMAWL